MGALMPTRGLHKDNFDVTTTGIDNKRGRVVKTSSVAIHAIHDKPGSSLWVGLKIHKTQKLLGLTVGGKEWVTAKMRADSDAQGAFEKLFRSVTKRGEKWVAFKVDHASIPTPPRNNPDYRIDTRLALDRHVVKHPDAQSITICVCYIPVTGALQLQQVLVGHSLVQAPPEKKGKNKST
jgi:hypothetical protein